MMKNKIYVFVKICFVILFFINFAWLAYLEIPAALEVKLGPHFTFS